MLADGCPFGANDSVREPFSFSSFLKYNFIDLSKLKDKQGEKKSEKKERETGKKN